MINTYANTLPVTLYLTSSLSLFVTQNIQKHLTDCKKLNWSTFHPLFAFTHGCPSLGSNRDGSHHWLASPVTRNTWHHGILGHQYPNPSSMWTAFFVWMGASVVKVTTTVSLPPLRNPMWPGGLSKTCLIRSNHWTDAFFRKHRFYAPL